MLNAIDYAKRSVYLEMYIFEENGSDYDFVSALERKARQGLRVIVILDALGSMRLDHSVRERLIAAGVEVMFYSYWLHRTHRKMLIVDEHVAFVGGVNIGARFKDWNDLVVRVSGRVARSVTHSFVRAYRACGGTDEHLTARAKETPYRRTRTWFYEHGLLGKRFTLREEYKQCVDSAGKSVVIVTPYFVPSKWLLAALGRACKRGVQVDVLVPVRPDHAFFSWINTYYAAMLVQLGARFYLHPSMNHAKALLIDERLGLVGSQNIDALSFARNAEAGVFFEGVTRVQALKCVINRWRSQSVLFRVEEHRVRWYDRVLALLVTLARPML